MKSAIVNLLTLSLFYIRKTFAVLLIFIASMLLFFIIINAETWAFCEKFNGNDARLIVMPLTIAGIIIGVLSWRYMKKVDILMILWYVVFIIWVTGNRLC